MEEKVFAGGPEVWMSVEWLGFAGTGLVVVAYLPQITHLARARCTAGVSAAAYAVWSASAVLLTVYALTTGDRVFIALQAYQLLALTSIYLLSRRHAGQTCDEHCGAEVGAGSLPVAWGSRRSPAGLPTQTKRVRMTPEDLPPSRG